MTSTKELYALLNRVRMLERFWQNAGFPMTEMYQSCSCPNKKCEYVETPERREYRSRGWLKGVNRETICEEIEKLDERVRILENWLAGIGYPDSEVYADWDKCDRQQLYLRAKSKEK